MSLPSSDEIRKRIEQILDERMKHCLMTAYLYAGRISEVIGHASPSDDTVARGPNKHDVKEEIYTIGNIVEPAIVFKVRTAKRNGRERQVALPVNYEPWALTVYEYFKRSDADKVFPFTRQLVTQYVIEHKTFGGLRYPIETYSIWKDGEIIKKVDFHMRRFTLHALRHLRASELVQFYGFDGRDLATYGGWTYRSFGFPTAADRYLSLGWQSYFPKLLKSR